MLRDYQEDALKVIEQSEEKNLCLTLPTGAGKTYTFCELAKRFYLWELKRVLILVHREELMNQAQKSLGEKCFRIEKGVKNIPNNFDFYVGMVETVARRLNKLPDFGLVIIDECHIGNFNKMPFFETPNVKVVGVTATPLGAKPLKNKYSKLIEVTTIKKLINNKHLLNCDSYAFASSLVAKQNFKVTAGEFDEKQLEDFYSSEKMIKNVVNAYWDLGKGQKTIIFNVNLAHNDAVYSALVSEGLNVLKIDGGTPKKERHEIIQKFKNDNDAIICNVGVLTAGFDEPSIKVVILNRATKSMPLYLQMVGRGSRLYENKNKFLLLDLGKNVERHGMYDDYRDWQTYFTQGSKPDSKGGASPTKECPECGFLQHTTVLECKNCGYSFEDAKKAKEQEEKQQKLVLIIKENPLEIKTEEIINLAKERGYKEWSVLHKIAEHVVKYEEKYKDELLQDYINSVSLMNLKTWCKAYGKKHNKFIDDLFKKYCDAKRSQNTTGDLPVVQ